MEPVMGVNLSIKNVPAEKVALLKQRAKNNHRSLQGEMLALIDSATQTATSYKAITIDELAENGRRLGLRTASESVQMIREDRDR
jgi:plasmid stability protein